MPRHMLSIFWSRIPIRDPEKVDRARALGHCSLVESVLVPHGFSLPSPCNHSDAGLLGGTAPALNRLGFSRVWRASILDLRQNKPLPQLLRVCSWWSFSLFECYCRRANLGRLR
eukprot:Protomagalhaensia_wolfi_Nauph_80__1624@NODE_1_length_8074_cov_174_317237_g0_i0_p11_GENE_NODE_1_length_8074_cov_174_317237_g0_i0NODE_1_length_8074_cov_174_317237_g0_i0_p11_ORF_typecomplete_len114_score4_55_NODE_1_length_8074_cov_174_317237_g0_i0368709